MNQVLIPGYNQFPEAGLNAVYLRPSNNTSMLEVLMPAVMRNADPEVGLATAQTRARELYGLPPAPHSELSLVDRAVLQLSHAQHRALAMNNRDICYQLMKELMPDDFVNINGGLVSMENVETALHRGEQLHADWFLKELLQNVKGLGAGYVIKSDLRKGTDVAVGTYGSHTFHPSVHPDIEQYIHLLLNKLPAAVLDHPQKIAKLPRLSHQQYVATGLARLSKHRHQQRGDNVTYGEQDLATLAALLFTSLLGRRRRRR